MSLLNSTEKSQVVNTATAAVGYNQPLTMTNNKEASQRSNTQAGKNAGLWQWSLTSLGLGDVQILLDHFDHQWEVPTACL